MLAATISLLFVFLFSVDSLRSAEFCNICHVADTFSKMWNILGNKRRVELSRVYQGLFGSTIQN